MLVSGRKGRLGYMMKTPHQSHSQNFCGDPRGVAGGDGKIGSLSGKAGTSHVCWIRPFIWVYCLFLLLPLSIVSHVSLMLEQIHCICTYESYNILWP